MKAYSEDLRMKIVDAIERRGMDDLLPAIRPRYDENLYDFVKP